MFQIPYTDQFKGKDCNCLQFNYVNLYDYHDLLFDYSQIIYVNNFAYFPEHIFFTCTQMKQKCLHLVGSAPSQLPVQLLDSPSSQLGNSAD